MKIYSCFHCFQTSTKFRFMDMLLADEMYLHSVKKMKNSLRHVLSELLSYVLEQSRGFRQIHFAVAIKISVTLIVCFDSISDG